MSEGIANLSTSGQEEDLSKYKGDEGFCHRWLKELDLVKNSKQQKAYEKVGEKIVKNFKNADSMNTYNTSGPASARVMLNVLWSNVKVLRPTFYCRMPKVVVERRFKDSDPVGRLACTLSERATSFNMATQQDRFNYAVKSAVQDRLLPGCGQVWLRYECEFEDGVDANGEPLLDASGNAVRVPKPNTEKAVIDPLNWLDYFHSLARNPYELRWQGRRVFMNKSELIKRFGKDIAGKIELGTDPSTGRKLSQEDQQFLSQAEVYEIQDLATKFTIWVSPGLRDHALDIQKNPLNLNEFWCTPIPLLATTTSDSMYPTPDYKIYERLADELDYVTKRISAMIDCIRFVGVHSAQFDKDVKNIMKLQDGQTWPMENWAGWTERSGFKGAIDWLPFDQCVAALAPLIEYQQTLLAQISEITGIPDIVRGVSDPTETLGAQQQKAHWTVVKIQEEQAEVQRFCREIISKMAEIIFEPGLFNDATIRLMCGVDQMTQDDQALFPQALALLRDDRLRTFRVDIETDSTIAIDEDQNQQRWMTYMQSIQSIVSEIQGVSQFRPELMHPIIESALGAVRSLRTGRQVEGAWEKALEQIEDADEQARANPQPPPPDPKLLEAQTSAQKAQAEIQLKTTDQQFNQQKEMQDFGLRTQIAQSDYAIKSQQVQIEAQKVYSKEQMDALTNQLEVFKAQFKQATDNELINIEKFKLMQSEKDRQLEAVRLEKEQLSENIRMMLEHTQATREAAIAMKESNEVKEKESKEPKEKSKPGKMHVVIERVGPSSLLQSAGAKDIPMSKSGPSLE